MVALLNLYLNQYRPFFHVNIFSMSSAGCSSIKAEEVQVAKSNETVLQVAILTGVHTRAGAEEDVFSRGCNLRDLVFSIWLPPRALLPVLNTAIILPHLKKQRRKRSFVRVIRMSMHLSRSVNRFNE